MLRTGWGGPFVSIEVGHFKASKSITFCKHLLTGGREVIVLQLLLFRTEEELVPVDETVRAELVGLMARIVVTVFQTEVRRTDERASIQSQDQAGTLGS